MENEEKGIIELDNYIDVAATKEIEVEIETVQTAGKKTRKPRTKTAPKEKNIIPKPEEIETPKQPTKGSKIHRNIYIEYLGKQINEEEIIDKVKTAWVKERKNKIRDIKTISLYIKPEDNAAYYIINDEITGSVYL